jgi:hypothetical protein
VARLSFPEHEARLPWLAALPQACAGSDEGVEKKGARRKLIKQSVQHRCARVPQQQDGARLASRMDQQAQQQQ